MQAVVFALVATTFLTIYVTQPVLPVLKEEFGVTPGIASLTVSAVVLGIALANLPFGVLADRFPIRPIVLGGGAVVALTSLACALTENIGLLVAARFLQGLFIPSMSTCLAAYLSRALPPDRLAVVRGCYVSATVAGGLGGRLLGGFVFPAEHWRLAFVAAGALVGGAVVAALRWLPREPPRSAPSAEAAGFLALLARQELLRMFAVGFFAFFVFSAMFNYAPFYLSGPPLHLSVRVITLLYLAYLVGIAAGPFSGTLTRRVATRLPLIAGRGWCKPRRNALRRGLVGWKITCTYSGALIATRKRGYVACQEQPMRLLSAAVSALAIGLLVSSAARADRHSCQAVVKESIVTMYSFTGCRSPVGICTIGTVGPGPLEGTSQFTALKMHQKGSEILYSGELV